MDQMDRKADDYWGSLLLAMVWDARQEGDLVTAELLLDEARRYFDEGDRLAERCETSRRALTARLRAGLGRPRKRTEWVRA